MIYRCILPDWAKNKNPALKKVIEGEFSDKDIREYNKQGYNIYFLPNYPSLYDSSKTVDGSQVDTFNYVFVDMDLKDGKYASKEQFIQTVTCESDLLPTFVVDSGNGVHAYWQVTDLDAISYLKLSRRFMRLFDTDEAVGQIYQLMRTPNTFNTKIEGVLKECLTVFESDKVYNCETLDLLLPIITLEDEKYCQQHYDKTYNLGKKVTIVNKLPLKFAKLMTTSEEAKSIWSGNTDDRSKGDYRLAHIMFGNGFTKDEALSVLVNSAKALERTDVHRVSYATNIVDKIWPEVEELKVDELLLSSSVKDILNAYGNELKGTRLPCWKYIDDTEKGFRLGHVIGLIAGSGVGKTTVALNMFLGFVQNNPNYVHFFIPLEQPVNEIAERWKNLCGENSQLHEKVQLLSNYNADGSFRHLSFSEIKEYVLKYQKVTGNKVGCIVIDHIGALKKKGKDGENQDLISVCHEMKAFALETNTLLIMQSQAPREKAGIGDLELNKDAAYGTVYFESYCDFLITLWQPLKRSYVDGAPTVIAFKFCKIRHKRNNVDKIKEDVRYTLFFDPSNERLREMNDVEEKSFEFFNNQATNKRKEDRKNDVLTYTSVRWDETKELPNASDNKDIKPIIRPDGLH